MLRKGSTIFNTVMAILGLIVAIIAIFTPIGWDYFKIIRKLMV